jgi:hypothetical protein
MSITQYICLIYGFSVQGASFVAFCVATVAQLCRGVARPHVHAPHFPLVWKSTFSPFAILLEHGMYIFKFEHESGDFNGCH